MGNHENIPEEHKPVVGFEDTHSVTECGKIYSHSRLIRAVSKSGLEYKRLVKGRWLKQFKNEDGYLVSNVCTEGVRIQKQVHRVVAEAWIPNPNNRPQVNHLDKTRDNPHYTNLEWSTVQENVEYSSAKYYEIDLPSGETIEIFNLSKFCRDEGMNESDMQMMSRVSRGLEYSYKGYVVRKIGENRV